MIIRKYKRGDTLHIDMTSESATDYYHNRKLIIDSLRKGDSHTIEVDGEIMAITCVEQTKYNGTYDCFCLFSKKAGAGVIRAVKKLLDNYMELCDIMITSSIDSDKNKKLHKMLGFDFCHSHGKERKLWVRLEGM